MAKDPGFIFYPGDYLRDTQCLSENVQVAYDRIMCEHMRNICISKTRLKFFTKRLNADEQQELFHVLEEVEGGFQISWVAESISKRKAYSASRRKNRESISKKHMSNISKTYDSHMDNENEIENVNDNKGKKGAGKKPIEYFTQLIPDTLTNANGFLDTWAKWVRFRIEIKKKLTKSTAEEQLKFLNIQPNPVQVMEKSIRNGWQGLFPIEDKPKETSNRVEQSINQTQSILK